MATKRLDMRRTREILRMKWERGLSHRKIARSLGISAGVVGSTVSRAKHAGLSIEGLAELSEDQLEQRLYGVPMAQANRASLPAPEHLDQELRRPGVTLELLHIEYLEEHPDGLRYTSFCNHYRKWKERQSPRMRQTHRAGEKLFVDYAGKRPRIVDRETGEAREVELFVAALGASNYTFAEATDSQKLEDWVGSHARCFSFLGGVTDVLVPDQLKSGVTKADAYEPEVNRCYGDMARHFDCVVVPARPAKPRDKAKVEVAVQIAERWILARIRRETFYSLEELNRRIQELLEDLNDRPMKKLGGVSRRELFERIERSELKPLPAEKYELARWKKARVNIDYHVEYDKHYYSVPHRLLKEEVEVRATKSLVEVFHRGKRVASHRRGRPLAGHSTNPEHMPASHRAHAGWSPSRLISWGGKMGPHTQLMVESILRDRPHPEMGYRSCLGILRLEKTYGAERLEAACERALLVNARSYQPVKAILKNGMDRQKTEEDGTVTDIPSHENVRGSEYFH
jgi:transposase